MGLPGEYRLWLAGRPPKGHVVDQRDRDDCGGRDLRISGAFCNRCPSGGTTNALTMAAASVTARCRGVGDAAIRDAAVRDAAVTGPSSSA